MSPRDWFWFLAGALVMVAIMVAVRALRERTALAARSPISALAVPVAAGLALLGVALGIYFLLGSPESGAPARAGAPQAAPASGGSASSPSQQVSASSSNAGSLDDVTRKLATRLATQGGSESEWKLLAESYDYMGRTQDAKNARAHIASASSPNEGSQQNALPSVGAGQMAAVAEALDGQMRGAPTKGSAPTSGGAEGSGKAEIPR